jgi:hypothetical protein
VKTDDDQSSDGQSDGDNTPGTTMTAPAQGQ